MIGDRKIGKPKLRWSDVIRTDMKEKWVERQETQDWRTDNENPVR